MNINIYLIIGGLSMMLLGTIMTHYENYRLKKDVKRLFDIIEELGEDFKQIDKDIKTILGK